MSRRSKNPYTREKNFPLWLAYDDLADTEDERLVKKYPSLADPKLKAQIQQRIVKLEEEKARTQA